MATRGSLEIAKKLASIFTMDDGVATTEAVLNGVLYKALAAASSRGVHKGLFSCLKNVLLATVKYLKKLNARSYRSTLDHIAGVTINTYNLNVLSMVT